MIPERQQYKPKRKIYVVDLDNTLCYTPEKEGPDGKIGPQYYESVPRYDRIAKINQLHREGNIVIIETARGFCSGKSWFLFTLHQLRDWGVEFDHLRTNTKMYGDVYIDDKAINDKDFFDG